MTDLLPQPVGPPLLPLEARALEYAAGGKLLVKGLSFCLESRGRTVILGPNGAGKSLLLRLCHGLLSPTGGEICWHGADGRDVSQLQSMVFQRPVMLRRTVLANAEYPLKLRRISRADRRQRALEILGRVGLAQLIDYPARRCSGGEQQLLSLARGWLTAPHVMFLDEPTANLDPASTHAIENTIRTITDCGTKIIMTTHDLAQARRLADDVMFIHRGRLIERSPAAQFFEAPSDELTRAFLEGSLLWWRRRALKPGGGVEASLRA